MFNSFLNMPCTFKKKFERSHLRGRSPSARIADCVCKGGGRGVHERGRRGMSASARTRFLPRPRAVKTCPRVKSSPRDNRGRGR
jgi:hypothetical protein